MDRHYILPVAFAAAAHGALLFGFQRTPHVAHPTERIPHRDFITPDPVEVDLTSPELPDSAEHASRPPDAPTPVAQPDSPVLVLNSDFRQPVTLTQTFDPTSITRVVPENIGVHSGDIAGRIGNIVGKEFLDNSPRTRFQSTPPYPYDAKRDGRSGEVVVEFVVDESGRVSDAHVVSSSDRVFEDSALRAVSKWLFEPGRKNGQIVRFRMAVPIVFKLNE